MKKIILICIIFSIPVLSQVDTLSLSAGDSISNLYEFDGNNALWFTVPSTFDGTTVTWMVSAYESRDSLVVLHNKSNNAEIKFTVTPGRSYVFSPLTDFPLQFWGAIKSDSTATGKDIFKIRPGNYTN